MTEPLRHYTRVKAKCLACDLHFIVCTWYPEKHTRQSLFCPQCGQHEGAFELWKQRVEGFIFQEVPGERDSSE
ncbi:MAG: hypothetical protein ACOYXC_19330 [Candidatus Rifleibacteriota bacterium]